jgi:hypothetical protein
MYGNLFWFVFRNTAKMVAGLFKVNPAILAIVALPPPLGPNTEGREPLNVFAYWKAVGELGVRSRRLGDLSLHPITLDPLTDTVLASAASSHKARPGILEGVMELRGVGVKGANA